MSKIVALSKFGFKLEGSNDWIKCDKSLLNSPMFKSLSKFMDVTLTQEDFNSKGFLISFDIPQHRDRSSSRDISLPTNKDVCSVVNPTTPSVKNSMMYGQCVNLAFNHVSSNECGLNIVEAFDLADKIYDEYIKRC